MSKQVRTALVVGAILCSLAVSLWQSQSGLRGIHFDFVARYGAGETVADGEDPYDEEAHFRHTEVYGVRGAAVFDAPPVIAAFRLATVLPLKAAGALLNILSYLSVAVLAWYITRRHRDRPEVTAHPLVVGGLCGLALLQAAPVRHTLALGQTDLVAMAMTVLLAAWVPTVAFFKPQTVALTAAAIFGRAVGVRWPPSLAAIRWKHVVVAIVSFVGLVAFSRVFAASASWDAWIGQVRGRQQAYERHPMTYLVAAVGIVVIVRGALLARRADRRVDVVCVAAAGTALLAAGAQWNPQWFLAVVITLGAVLVPYLSGSLPLGRVHGSVLVLVCAVVAGDGFVSYGVNDPSYHPEVPMVGLAALLFAFWLLRLVPLVPALAIVILNTVLVVVPLTVAQRVPLSMAACVGALFLLFEVRSSGLLTRSEESRGALPAVSLAG